MKFSLSTRPLSAFRLAAALGLLLVGALLFAVEPEPAPEAERVVVLVSVDSIIHPVAEASRDAAGPGWPCEPVMPGGPMGPVQASAKSAMAASTVELIFMAFLPLELKQIQVLLISA